MTDQEWAACTDVNRMLVRLTGMEDLPLHPGPPEFRLISNRKLRLFLTACGRTTWQTTSQKSREMLAEAEAYADGLTTYTISLRKWWEGLLLTHPMAEKLSRIASFPEARVGLATGLQMNYNQWPHQAAGLLRDIIGPLNQKFETDPRWLTPLVKELVEAAYLTRGEKICLTCKGTGSSQPGASFHHYDHDPGCKACGHSGRDESGALSDDRLAILADSLEEAGCDNSEILQHLRGREQCPDRYCHGRGTWLDAAGDLEGCSTCRKTGWIPLRQYHVRGCWVLDLLREESCPTGKSP